MAETKLNPDALPDLFEALRPFAAISLLRDNNYRPRLPDAIDAPDLTITPDDIRRARAALAKARGETT